MNVNEQHHSTMTTHPLSNQPLVTVNASSESQDLIRYIESMPSAQELGLLSLTKRQDVLRTLCSLVNSREDSHTKLLVDFTEGLEREGLLSTDEIKEVTKETEWDVRIEKERGNRQKLAATFEHLQYWWQADEYGPIITYGRSPSKDELEQEVLSGPTRDRFMAYKPLCQLLQIARRINKEAATQMVFVVACEAGRSYVKPGEKLLTDVNKRINEQLRLARDREENAMKRQLYQVTTNGRTLSNKSMIAHMT